MFQPHYSDELFIGLVFKTKQIKVWLFADRGLPYGEDCSKLSYLGLITALPFVPKRLTPLTLPIYYFKFYNNVTLL